MSFLRLSKRGLSVCYSFSIYLGNKLNINLIKLYFLLFLQNLANLNYLNMPKFTVKAGRFTYDKQTKKVKPQVGKGRIIVQHYQNQGETHFKWIDLQTNTEEIDMIVFASDAVFEQIAKNKNTFVLKFQTDQDKYFFWLQEKVDQKQVLSKINDLINFDPESIINQEIKQEKPFLEEPKTQKMDTQPAVKEQPAKKQQKPLFAQDFISRMQKNIQTATKGSQKSITHLQKIVGSQAINFILKECSQQQKKQLVQFLPEEQQSTEFIESNLRSAQFFQALDVLSDALNSQNAIPLFMQMGLNQNYLQKNYGVHAFLKALVDWGKQQKSKQKKQ